MALYLDIGINDALHFKDGTKLVLERKSGQRARLRIEGPAAVELVKGGRDMDTPPAFDRERRERKP